MVGCSIQVDRRQVPKIIFLPAIAGPGAQLPARPRSCLQAVGVSTNPSIVEIADLALGMALDCSVKDPHHLLGLLSWAHRGLKSTRRPPARHSGDPFRIRQTPVTMQTALSRSIAAVRPSGRVRAAAGR